MENADHMEGFRTRGEYILTGHVRFHHGNLHFETDRAVWQREQNRVNCEAGMRITQRGALLTADRGSYDKSKNQALAQGRVFFRDSSGEMEGRGDHLTYDRLRHDAVLTGHPEVRRLYQVKPGDTVGTKTPDTLSIRGTTLRSNDSTGVAEASGKVFISRRDLRITCGHAEYRQKADSMFLSQDPKVEVENSEVKGLLMRLALKGEALRGLLVQGKAEALSLEQATDSTRARKSRVEGDSLRLAFREGAVESVQVFRRATGTYYDVDRPEYVNRMSGDYMVLRFRERKVHDADVLGSARSTYYHFENDSLKGKNQAQGDTIAFAFKEGKIDEVLVRGNARGTYEGRGLSRAKKTGTAGNGKK